MHPGSEHDYFANEQVATWAIDEAVGVPENPRVEYYRTFATRVGKDAHLYEFVVPMVPPSWNDQDRVHTYGDALRRGSKTTAVAVSTLDITQPAIEPNDGSDYYAHWALTHFLLDGHHKMQAAAATGHALQLLTLVGVGASLAQREDIERLPALRSRESTNRPVNARRPSPT